MGKREVGISLLKAVPWTCSAYPEGEMVGKVRDREKGIGDGWPHSL